MKQLTLRVNEDLARGLKQAAADRQESVNTYATAVLSAAIDPDLADGELDRLRGRLDRAGLLAQPSEKRVERPAEEEVSQARRSASKGRNLAELVSEGRG